MEAGWYEENVTGHHRGTERCREPRLGPRRSYDDLSAGSCAGSCACSWYLCVRQTLCGDGILGVAHWVRAQARRGPARMNDAPVSL